MIKKQENNHYLHKMEKIEYITIRNKENHKEI